MKSTSSYLAQLVFNWRVGTDTHYDRRADCWESIRHSNYNLPKSRPTVFTLPPKERLHLPNIKNAAGGGQEAQETFAVGFADDPGV